MGRLAASPHHESFHKRNSGFNPKVWTRSKNRDRSTSTTHKKEIANYLHQRIKIFSSSSPLPDKTKPHNKAKRRIRIKRKSSSSCLAPEKKIFLPNSLSNWRRRRRRRNRDPREKVNNVVEENEVEEEEGGSLGHAEIVWFYEKKKTGEEDHLVRR